MTREIGFINGFRAIAAFWVLTAHCLIWGGTYEGLVPRPELAVDLFMIISGFLMALNANIRETNEPLAKLSSWLIFWLRRYFRLAPVYYLALLLAFLCSDYFLSGFQALRDINPHRLQNDTVHDPKLIKYTLENIFYHITFMFGMVPKFTNSTSLPDWSLSLEMQFYLTFPFIYLAMRNWGYFRVGLLLAFTAWLLNKIIIKIAWLNGIAPLFHEPSILPMKLQYFLIGILVYEIGWNSFLSTYSKRLYMMFALGLSLIEVQHYQQSVLWLPFLVILILAVQHQSIRWWPIARIRSLLESRLMHLASEASYSVYLFHGFFISLCGQVIANSPDLLSIDPAIRVGFIWLFVALCSYAFAFLIFNYVENPGIRLGKSLITTLQNKWYGKSAITKVSTIDDTDPDKSLKRRSVKALLWTGSELLMRQGVRFGVAIFLARLLSPAEFGTVALLSIFIGIGNVFIESGFSSALVQKQDINHTDESSVFWFNLGMGALVAILLWLSAPFIADFYQRPILIPLTGVLALSVFISAIGGIHQTLLTKKLNFKAPMQASVTASLISSTLVCVLAYYGYGVWALAWQTLAESLVTCSLLWFLSGWRPRFIFSTSSVKKLFGFGSYLMLSRIMDVIYTRFYGLLIGKIYSIHDLGIYTRAENTKQMPVDLLSMMLYRVAFPLFSAAASDYQRLRRGMVIALRGIMFLNVPMMLGLMVTADKVVPVLFGEQWTPSVPLLQVLCLAGVLWPLHVINLSVLKSLGHSHLFFRLEIIKKLLGVSFILCGLHYGIMGLAWSQVVSGVVSFWINAFYTRKFLKYGALNQVLDFLPVTVISIIMAIAVFYAGQVFTLPINSLLLIQVGLGAFLYWGLCSTFNVVAYRDILNLLMKKRIA